MAPKKGSLIATTKYPLYAVRALDHNHFLVAGGGGQAKTGIPNAIEVFEVRLEGGVVVASSLHCYDPGSQAVMNCAAILDGKGHVVAAGQEDECQLYRLKYTVVSPVDSSPTESNGDVDLRKRKGGESNAARKQGTKQLTFDVEPLKSVKTDFHKDGGFQKVVCFSLDNTLMATGGADGHIRIWKYPDLNKVKDIKAHKNDIDGLDFHPLGDRLVSVSRDQHGCVWDVKDGKKRAELQLPVTGEKYRFRSCRYGVTEKKDKFHLFTISIPLRMSQQPCYLTLWDTESCQPRKMVKTGTEALSALAVSKDGVFAAVGTISGSVAVYIAFSLQKLYEVKETHSIFVTGLDFMPVSEGEAAVMGNEFNLLSISADNTVQLHQMPARSEISIVWVLAGTFLMIYMLFWLMANLGL